MTEVCSGKHILPMKTKATHIKAPPETVEADHDELPDILDTYWASCQSRHSFATLGCWTTNVSALGMSSALPMAHEVHGCTPAAPGLTHWG